MCSWGLRVSSLARWVSVDPLAPLPPTPFYIPIPFAPSLLPSVSQPSYTYIHSPATFLHPPSLLFLFYTSPIPLPPISLFWYFLWVFPCYQHHPPPLHTY